MAAVANYLQSSLAPVHCCPFGSFSLSPPANNINATITNDTTITNGINITIFSINQIFLY